MSDRVSINIQDDILKLHGLGLLEKLLADKTTKRNILWAANAYRALGPQYECNEEITSALITGPHCSVIKTRARKAAEQQSSRTRQHGEVSTPLWVCRKMCGCADEMWNSKARWQKYVDARVLEIACGEAPFLASRYDAETGEGIPVPDRIGLLDRKLQKVNENTHTEEDWLKWAFRAFQATYGYEFQGDNLLISRVNLLMTFEEYLWERWRREPARREYEKATNIIAWNIFQMDGLRGTIPYGAAEEECQVVDWFGMLETGEAPKRPRCRVHNWTNETSFEFSSLPVRGKHGMKFDFVIGNPPYQEDRERTSDKPIYNFFMDSVFGIADKVQLITPARFLFNAGKTPKAWNEKMLADPHFKVLYYEQDSSKVFANTDIMGGVAITYRDASKTFEAIEVFSAFDELRGVKEKAQVHAKEDSIASIMMLQNRFDLELLYQDYPECSGIISSGGKERRIVSSAFEKLPVFKEEQTGDRDIRILGVAGTNKRQYRWIDGKYVEDNGNLLKWKVLVPKSNGSGAIGEVVPTPLIGTPLIGAPHTGFTQSFISIGAYDTEDVAKAALKYVKSKFLRALLGILKITQDNPPDRWRFIPLQDFTASSDIDWTKSIPEIDQQLYAKYGLDEKEIRFIETHVKEME